MMSDDSSGWCPDHAICTEWIERRALYLVENFQQVDTVYMSLDIYAQYMKQSQKSARIIPTSSMGVLEITHIATSVATLEIVKVSHFCNFCHVGTKSTYRQLEQHKIDQDFEKIVLGRDTN